MPATGIPFDPQRGERIDALINRLPGMSKTKLAAALGLTTGRMISEYVKGKPMEAIRLTRLAEVLGVTEDEILHGDGEHAPVDVAGLRRADVQIIRRLESVEAQLRATEHQLADLATAVGGLLERLESWVLQGPPPAPERPAVARRRPSSKRTSAATRPTATPPADA